MVVSRSKINEKEKWYATQSKKRRYVVLSF